MIVEYMLEQVGRGDAKRAPTFIRDGGYHFNSSDYTYVGWVPNLAEREFYIPDSLTVLTRESIVTRALAMHAANTMQQEDPDNEGQYIDMTDAEVTSAMQNWWDGITSLYAQKPASATIEADTDNNHIEVKVTFARKGVVISGTPQLTVDIDGSSVVLSASSTNYNSIIFSASHTLNGGETITVSASSSIDLNGGTITDGTDNALVALSLSEDVTATA